MGQIAVQAALCLNPGHMHIAVTGGSGDFARVLIGHLGVRGHTVRSLDRPGRDAPAGVRERRTLDLRDAAAAARAVELALGATFPGHEVFFIVAPRTFYRAPSLDLARKHYPGVPIVRDMPDNTGFYDCRKAKRILGWQHDVNGGQD
jgi:nucleoside-diphosphate-sugar epimerase